MALPVPTFGKNRACGDVSEAEIIDPINAGRLA
jgi:hypothetical protein